MLNTITPVFEDAVVIVFSSSENFAPFSSAAILSLLDHASPDRYYDIIILDTDMSDWSKKMYLQLIEGRPNVCLRFYSVRGILRQYKFEHSDQWTDDCYGRLLIPDILPGYIKAVYLDGDQIIKTDVAELFDMDVSDIGIAAFPHVGIAADLNGYDPSGNTYDRFINCVKIKEENLHKVFMTSTLIMNLIRIRDQYSHQYFLEYAQRNNFRLLDMDVLNYLFQDDVMLISQTWGWYAASKDDVAWQRFAYAPRNIYDEYLIAGKNPKIIHFGGYNKPWERRDRACAEEFWQVFRRTSFYAVYLVRQLSNTSAQADVVEEFRFHLTNLENATADLQTKIEAHQRWMNRIRLSLPYRIVRKLKSLICRSDKNISIITY